MYFNLRSTKDRVSSGAHGVVAQILKVEEEGEAGEIRFLMTACVLQTAAPFKGGPLGSA